MKNQSLGAHLYKYSTIVPLTMFHALVQFGGGITKMSGSIAGNTFGRNRSGNYVRSRTKPVNPNSAGQVKIRAALAYLTEYWKDFLSEDNRIAWATYATAIAMKNKLGETIKLSGFNHFIRSNSIRLHNNTNVLHEGPVINTLPEHDPTLSIDVDETPQKIAVSFDAGMAWNKEVGGCLFIQQGRPQNITRNFFGGPYRLSGHFAGTALNGSASPRNTTVTFPVAVGQRVWCRFRIARGDGRLSEPWSVLADVHAAAPGEVPNVIGMTQALATAAIIERQLVLGDVTEANSDTVPVGCVISQDPVVHTQLRVGDPVHLVISLGPAE
ncbi:hypothetical protein ES703_18845 [subsurface metagenome]